jgi:nicotinate phosphoribosyltransferase
MKALHTDLYQLTMAAGYFESGKADETAVFELFVRRLPANREYLIAAGLQQAVEYLLELQFTGEQIDYLRTLEQFQRVSQGFWEYLRSFRFTGDLFAMPEGTPFFPAEPIAILRAPLAEAQIPETYLLAALGHQSMIAAKAWRVVRAARGRSVVEFGTRRAHGAEAGVLTGRAAYIAGCAGTSNVESGFRFGIPVFGTCAHSWVLAFESETESFRELQKLLGEGTVYLIDSYDTVEGARKAAGLGPPIWGVRLDSGDLLGLSKQVRSILDAAGLHDAKIMASSDLNEDRIAELLAHNAPIDSFGVGTELATSFDAPAVSAVYKISEIANAAGKRYVAKYSSDKRTYPGAKQVFRYADRDVIGYSSECAPDALNRSRPEALLRPVIVGGKLVEPLPPISAIREYCAQALGGVSGDHKVEYSPQLLAMAERHRAEHRNESRL